MPISRAVPRPSRLWRLHRRLAHLPVGGPTGIACAAAGLACAIGLVVVRPDLEVPRFFERGEARPPAVTAEAKAGTEARQTATRDAVKARVTGSEKGSRGPSTRDVGRTSTTSAKHLGKPSASPSAVPDATPPEATPSPSEPPATAEDETSDVPEDREDPSGPVEEDDHRDGHRGAAEPRHDDHDDRDASDSDDRTPPNEPMAAS